LNQNDSSGWKSSQQERGVNASASLKMERRRMRIDYLEILSEYTFRFPFNAQNNRLKRERGITQGGGRRRRGVTQIG